MKLNFKKVEYELNGIQTEKYVCQDYTIYETATGGFDLFFKNIKLTDDLEFAACEEIAQALEDKYESRFGGSK
jgi:hypothetical protein